MAKANNGKAIFLSNCAVWDSKKFKFIKKQEAREILSSLGLKNTFKQNSAISCDEIINMVLLRVDNFLDEIPLIQPAFAYSDCGSFTKNKEKYKNIKETGDSRYIYQNELEKACFHHDVAHGDSRDLPRF